MTYCCVFHISGITASQRSVDEAKSADPFADSDEDAGDGGFQHGQIEWCDVSEDMDLPCGKLTKSYWKLPFIVDFPIKNGHFQLLC